MPIKPSLLACAKELLSAKRALDEVVANVRFHADSVEKLFLVEQKKF
jgi:hypothetical protein